MGRPPQLALAAQATADNSQTKYLFCVPEAVETFIQYPLVSVYLVYSAEVTASSPGNETVQKLNFLLAVQYY